MAKIDLAGRCGLFCGACNIYRAERDDPSWRQRLADHFKCRPDQVCCRGCRALTGGCWGNGCKIVICLRERGYDSCHLCPELSAGCERFDQLASGYQEDGVDLRRNLEGMHAMGFEAWLARAEERHTCTSCGRPLAVGRDRCHHCGRILDRR